MPGEIITSPKVSIPNAVISHAIRVPAGNLVFVSGQTARNAQREIVGVGDIEAQTHQVFANIMAVLEEAGATLQDVVKANIYVTDIKDQPKVTEVRKGYFGETRPASTFVQVKSLAHPDILIEIEVVAVAP
ncbi:MAG: RidA family protein [Dehalococcoidia bacterium]|nr:RidA family protein [Dehalococcoidia bacterium]